MLDVYARQLGIVPPEKLDFPIFIAGAGASGSWISFGLTKLGCSCSFIGVHFDKVSSRL